LARNAWKAWVASAPVDINTTTAEQSPISDETLRASALACHPIPIAHSVFHTPVWFQIAQVNCSFLRAVIDFRRPIVCFKKNDPEQNHHHDQHATNNRPI
jgi:hypothetical protein